MNILATLCVQSAHHAVVEEVAKDTRTQLLMVTPLRSWASLFGAATNY